MRFLLSISFLLIMFVGISQKPLKKKYRGNYVGSIPSYSVFVGEQPLIISKTDISIFLDKTTITMQVGKISYEGLLYWSIENNEIIINARIEGLSVPEKISVDLKTKEMVRIGRSPQPNSKLLKVKKSKK